jgi:hypothetical protein
MDSKNLADIDNASAEKQLILQPPSQVFRLGWLIAGLIMGYFVSLINLPSIGWLTLLAVLTGASSNWSS